MTTSCGLDPLMDFRVAYLRAIAHSWTQWPFDRPLEGWIGRHNPFLQELLSGRDIQGLLQRLFGMRTNWPDLAICLEYHSEKSAGWQPVKTAGWVGQDDQFIITLPKKPDDDTAAVEALAAYYQRFPTLLGAAEIASPNDLPPAGASSYLQGSQDAALPTGLGVPGGGPGTLLAFGGVILRAIALAWADGTFYEALTNNDQTVPSPTYDASPTLSKWLGYNSPFNFKIQFLGGSALRWDGKKWNYAQQSDGPTREKPNAVVLNYPAPPDSRHYSSLWSTATTSCSSLWPIALTSYNNTGEAYPFTCMGN